MIWRSSATARRKLRRLSSQVFTRNRLPITVSLRSRDFCSKARIRSSRPLSAEGPPGIVRTRAIAWLRLSSVVTVSMTAIGFPSPNHRGRFSRSCPSCLSRSLSAAGSHLRRYGRMILIPSAISSGVRMPSSAARTSGAWSKESSRMLMLVTTACRRMFIRVHELLDVREREVDG